ncbi:MAG TPA: hypothetical protein DCZ56_04455 [Sutterella sp.]|nr:hypothetical protein [Sutterella sp.]
MESSFKTNAGQGQMPGFPGLFSHAEMIRTSASEPDAVGIRKKRDRELFLNLFQDELADRFYLGKGMGSDWAFLSFFQLENCVQDSSPIR